ncbi:putative mRNA-capping enzyme [Frankliniella fusca]|uniref:mRNA-capping enzyme n=1 Tax=Frankliniella fusca TaxID=407009 RepID=A0AAE1H4U5_9NEOP|nr:putative mRNA-capping enzyme [Frankliniella fusca]
MKVHDAALLGASRPPVALRERSLAVRRHKALHPQHHWWRKREAPGAASCELSRLSFLSPLEKFRMKAGISPDLKKTVVNCSDFDRASSSVVVTFATKEISAQVCNLKSMLFLNSQIEFRSVDNRTLSPIRMESDIYEEATLNGDNSDTEEDVRLLSDEEEAPETCINGSIDLNRKIPSPPPNDNNNNIYSTSNDSQHLHASIKERAEIELEPEESLQNLHLKVAFLEVKAQESIRSRNKKSNISDDVSRLNKQPLTEKVVQSKNHHLKASMSVQHKYSNRIQLLFENIQDPFFPFSFRFVFDR